ncbi:MAG: outer membrane beta-barrel protein [Rhodospirillales bacterium]|nr:outer membrane beta-barrel protein [Rhodospirillales bacterium]
MAILTAAATGPAAAQTAKEDSVTQRGRPDFEPLGLDLDLVVDKLGRMVGVVDGPPRDPQNFATGIVARPSLGIQHQVDDNIYRLQNNPQSDRITVFQPGLNLSTDWDNHSLSFGVSGAFGRYTRFTAEDYDDYTLSTSGRLDISEDLQTSLGLTHSLLRQ